MKNYMWIVCCSLFACSSHQDPSSMVQIYGGKKVKSGEWLNTVAIVDQDGMYCTGTALTPKLIVTAAHCVEGEKVSQMQVYVGSGAKNGDVEGQYAVASAAYSPLYNPKDEDSDHDVGYLLLKKPLDLPPSAFVPVATEADEIEELIAVGQSSRIVGFGDIDNGSYGLKYEATTTITAVGSTEVSIGGRGKDSCYGDSGGPAFGQLSDGTWRVYGVVSRGDECGQGGIWGLIHANICWIQDDSGIDLKVAKGLCARPSMFPGI